MRSLGFRHQEVAELAAFGMFAAGAGLDSQNFHDALHADALLVGLKTIKPPTEVEAVVAKAVCSRRLTARARALR